MHATSFAVKLLWFLYVASSLLNRLISLLFPFGVQDNFFGFGFQVSTISLQLCPKWNHCKMFFFLSWKRTSITERDKLIVIEEGTVIKTVPDSQACRSRSRWINLDLRLGLREGEEQ